MKAMLEKLLSLLGIRKRRKVAVIDLSSAIREASMPKQGKQRMMSFKRGHRVQLSANFYSTEFDSKGGYPDGESTLINLEHVKKLQQLRDFLGAKCTITSGYRGPTHNQAVGGVPNSQHLLGNATDVVFEGISPDEVADAAEILEFDGIGRYDTFTHLDSRGSKARWDNRSK